MFKFRKRRESKRPYKRTIERERKITYVIKEPLTDNKEVNNTKAQKDKDNNNQVILKKKEKKEEPEDKKETKSDHGIQASNVFAIMSGLFVLFLVLKSNKEWG